MSEAGGSEYGDRDNFRLTSESEENEALQCGDALAMSEWEGVAMCWFAGEKVHRLLKWRSDVEEGLWPVLEREMLYINREREHNHTHLFIYYVQRLDRASTISVSGEGRYRCSNVSNSPVKCMQEIRKRWSDGGGEEAVHTPSFGLVVQVR